MEHPTNPAGVIFSEDSEEVTTHRLVFVGWTPGAAEAARINFERADGIMAQNAEAVLLDAIFADNDVAPRSRVRWTAARAVRESAWIRLRTLAGRGNVRAQRFFAESESAWQVL